MTIRVFPRRTAMTPTDPDVFIGEPGLFRPGYVGEIEISCLFSWDRATAFNLAESWGRYYDRVRVGGPAVGSPSGEFVPGRYTREGVVVTSRGCNNDCPWCLVPKREGKLREIEIHEGRNVIDNNLLGCRPWHRRAVFEMLRTQRGVQLTGGLALNLVTDEVVDELRSLALCQMFVACDYQEAIGLLEIVGRKLRDFTMRQLRCYALIAYGNETPDQAVARLRTIYELGFMPFAQLYQPADHYIEYSAEWHRIANIWSRPARIKAVMSGGLLTTADMGV